MSKLKSAMSREKEKNIRVRKYLRWCSLNLRNNQNDCPPHRTVRE